MALTISSATLPGKAEAQHAQVVDQLDPNKPAHPGLLADADTSKMSIEDMLAYAEVTERRYPLTLTLLAE